MKLLTSNTKLNKSSQEYISLGLQLTPYKLQLENKTVNSCTNAFKYGCHKTCVYFSGHGIYSNVQRARIERTKLFYNDFKTFKNLLELELITENIKAKKQNKILTVRLNTYSDINIIKFFGDLIEKHQDIQFYDYSKIDSYIYTLKKYHDKNQLKNYNIVYSYNIDDLDNEIYLKSILDITSIVLVLPVSSTNKDYNDFFSKYTKFKGYDIANGDLQDVRIEKSKIILLSFKGGKDKLLNEIMNNNKIILPLDQFKHFS